MASRSPPPSHVHPDTAPSRCRAAGSLELRNLLTTIETNELHEMKTQINLGCEFYMQATMCPYPPTHTPPHTHNQLEPQCTEPAGAPCRHSPSTERVYVDVGLGVHVDFSRQEALAFISQREAAYDALCDGYTEEMRRVRQLLEARLSAESGTDRSATPQPKPPR